MVGAAGMPLGDHAREVETVRRFASGELVDTPSLGRALQSASSALGLPVEVK